MGTWRSNFIDANTVKEKSTTNKATSLMPKKERTINNLPKFVYQMIANNANDSNVSLTSKSK